jgi:predicted DNA-binding protein (MmcQ/YjbR family)
VPTTRRRPAAKKPRAAAKAKPRVSTHPAKKRTPVSRAIIERLRKLCLRLDDATEVIAWGEPTWRVRNKIFAMVDDHHHGAQHVSVWMPAPDGAQQALIDSDPERFFRPPYVGHRGWVAIILDTDPDWNMVGALLEQAHGLVKSGSGARRARASLA